MPSPFPGMNPYLEQADTWHDFHERFIPAIAEALAPQVRPHYIVKLDEQVYIHELPHPQRQFLGRPDIALTPASERARDSEPVAAVEAPFYGRFPTAVDFERLAFIEIRDRQSREVVTVVELLSPANKNPGPDREQYLAKRRQLLVSAVHLVEIDLLRGGQRLPLDGLPACDYCVTVSRYEERPRVGIWPIGLRDSLPWIPIPLRGSDRPARLDLQAILNRTYDAAGYEDYLYTGSPTPPLGAEDLAWARRFLPGAHPGPAV